MKKTVKATITKQLYAIVSSENLIYTHTIHQDPEMSILLWENDISHRKFDPWGREHGYRLVDLTVTFDNGRGRKS